MPPFVDRDPQGNITATYNCQQRGGQEYVEGDVQPFEPFSFESVLNEVREIRELIFTPLDRIQMRALSSEDQLKIDVEVCKQKLRDFPEQLTPKLTEGMTLAQMRKKATDEYKLLAAATPSNIRSAFNVLVSK